MTFALFLCLQEKMIDLESEVEELHDSEQRWAVKHKRAVEQVGWPSANTLSLHLKKDLLRDL